MPRRSHTALDPPGAIEVSDDEVISIEDSDAVEEHDPSAGSQGSNSFSNNINKDLAVIFQHILKFKGTFACAHSYSTGDVPNPCLSVTGLGSIGLPLNDREARAIITSCEQGSISAECRDGIWDILAEQIHFQNPAWNTWLNSKLVPVICKALDTNRGVPPNFVLNNLSVRGVSSQVMKPKNIKHQDTMFGTLLITLPSEFTGGGLLLSYAGQTRKVDFAPNSSSTTHIVASYVGVEQLLQPVATGYHLTLSYSLLHPRTHMKSFPALPDIPRAARRLHKVLRSWKQIDDEVTPQLVACLLRYKYAREASFGAKSLIRSDANLFSLLRPIAAELGFQMYLAHIDFKRSVPASVPGRGSDRDGYDTSDAECDRMIDKAIDVDSLELDETEDETEECFSIRRIVDLDGIPVKVEPLPIEMNDIINGSWKNRTPDKKLFAEAEFGLGFGTLTLVYRRVALLLWPKNSGLAVKVGDVHDYASHKLKQSKSLEPTTREVNLVNNLLQWCSRQPKSQNNAKGLITALGALRQSAERWNAVDLLLEALKSCGVDRDIGLFGIESFISECQTFGWDAMREFCTTSIQNDKSNLSRHALVQGLMVLAKEEPNDKLVRWCVEQWDVIYQSLKTVNADEIEWLVEIAKRRDADYFQSVILPQLVAQPLAYTFWLPFFARLEQETQNIPRASSGVITNMISQCVVHAVTTFPAFPVKQVKYYSSVVDRMDVDLIMDLIEVCVKTNEASSCAAVFSKLKDASSKGPRHRDPRAVDYYSALITALDRYLDSNPRLDAFSATFTDFFSVGVDVLLDSTPNHKCSAGENEQRVKLLILAVRRAGGVSILREKLTPDRAKRFTNYPPRQLALSVVSSLKPPNGDQRAFEDYRTLVEDLVHAAITFSYRNLNSNREKLEHKATELVKFCVETGATSQFSYVVACLIAPPPTMGVSPKTIPDSLISFVRMLKQFFLSNTIDLAAEPWRRIFVAAVEGFTNKFMTPKPQGFVPASQLQRVGCGCDECTELQTFFFGDKDVISLAKKQRARAHLVERLRSTEAWGVKWETIEERGRQTLRVSKPADMRAIGLWSAASAKGQSLLALLGNKEKQQQILGSAFANVHAKILGTTPPPVARGPVTLVGKRPSTATGSAPNPKRRKHSVN